MEIVPGVTPREKMIGTLTYLIFFLPMIMDEKTEFTIFQARQSFGILLLWIAIAIIGIIPLLGQVIYALGAIALVVTVIFLMIKAYSGEKFLIAPLYDFSTKAITKMKIEKFFMTH